MKFWQKTLLLVLALFIIALDISVLLVMNKSWSLNIAREQQRAEREQALIANNIYENLGAIASRGMAVDETVMDEVARSYIAYYKKQNIALQLWDTKKQQPVYPSAGGEKTQSEQNQNQNQNQDRTLALSQELPSPYEHIVLKYSVSMEELFASHAELNRYFVFINCIAGPLLALAFYLLIRRLTKPLRELSRSAKTIAAGRYDARITLHNRDEFGELAENFNQMAKAVESHVTELSAMASEKQRFVDNLAHELRTPLTSMQGFAQYLNTANIGEKERITASGHLWRETLRLKAFIFKLLELSTLRGQAIEGQPLKTADLLTAVAQMEQPALK